MSSSPPNHNGMRSIVQSSKAQEQEDDASKKFERFADAWLGFTWRLIRGPDAGVPVGKGHFVMKFPAFTRIGIDVPSVTILYSYDDQNVHIESILISGRDDE